MSSENTSMDAKADSKQRRYICYCREVYNDVDAFKKHLSEVHDEKWEPIEYTSKYVCCDGLYETYCRYEFIEHLQEEHPDEDPYYSADNYRVDLSSECEPSEDELAKFSQMFHASQTKLKSPEKGSGKVLDS